MSSHSHHEHYMITKKNKKIFLWAATLTTVFAVLEVIYGFLSGSLMIVGDGVHMSSDAASLTMSLIAVILATKAATKYKTFGYKRFEPIAAFINGLTLLVIPLYIIYEAVSRIIHPVAILSKQMLIVGCIGLFINITVGLVLSKGQSNLNMRSAMIHVVADIITNISTITISLCIMFFHWGWLDPIGSIVTSVIIIRGGYAITKESLNILMEGTPEGYSSEEVQKALEELPEVVTVTDVKVWCINDEDIYTAVRLLSSSTITNELVDIFKKTITSVVNVPLDRIYLDVSMAPVN